MSSSTLSSEPVAAEPARSAPIQSKSLERSWRHGARAGCWLLICAFCAWAAGAGLSFYTARLDFSEPKGQESLSFRGQSFDTIYFGNSLVLQGVDAAAIDAALGTHSYNMALGGAPILESEIQLRHYLRHNRKPGLVLLNLYINEHQFMGVRPSVWFALDSDLRALYRKKLRQYETDIIDLSFLAFNAIPAYRYRGTIDLIIKDLIRSDQAPVFVQGQARVRFRNSVELGPRHRASINEGELRSFLDLCREQGVLVLLFESPNSPGYSDLTVNRREILEQVNVLVRAYPGVHFLSFNRDPAAEYLPDDWVNRNHLNQKGAVKFSGRLAHVISWYRTETKILESRDRDFAARQSTAQRPSKIIGR